VSGCLAQSGPTIKGHTLGESITEFISKTNSGPRLEKCREKEAKHPKKNTQWCKSFIAAVDTGGRFATTLDAQSISDTATFDRGKLVAIHIRTTRYGYADMLRDMKTRLGNRRKQKISSPRTVTARRSTIHVRSGYPTAFALYLRRPATSETSLATTTR
jgi:hypothetical protein